jgi:predicted  nucleic acid-binding Zn-ribbon protein
MKKIFSAFLLMTMMVFSVGSFVSCSDLENEIAKVDTQANANAAAIESLNSEIAALKTALSAAQADADAAMTAAKAAKEAGDAAKAEAEAAKAAAAQAKAEALAAVAEELEAIQTAIAVNVEAITNLGGSVNANAVEIEALQEEVKALQTAAAEAVYAITNLNGSVEKHENAIADLETEVAVLKATIANYEANLKELGLFDEEMKKQIEGITYAITNLDKAVETNTNEIDALKEQLEDVVAQVETLNASLVAIYDILGVLANQIQSVVFVPEFQNEGLTAERFTYSTTVKSNYLAIGTYEVRPAKLAASLTSENLSFASVDLKTKAANAPEYFKAEIIGEPDPATGRVVVAAVINNNKDVKDNDYAKVAEGVVALSLNIASVDVTELLIAESAAANVEMVSSEYVTITSAKDLKVTELVGFPVVSQGVKGITSNYTNSVEMPWNTPLANSKVNLFETEVCVLVQDTFLSLEKASELLGLEFAVAYPENGYKLETNAGTDKDSPIKVTGKDLTATAELVVSEDYVDNAAVGQYAKVTLKPDVKVGKVVVNNHLNAVATYTVDNKQSDFTFADAEKVAWVYADGDNARTFTQELAVVGFDKMKKGDKFTFTTMVGETPFSANVTALSSKAVELEVPAGLPYKQGEDAVYEFKGTVTYDKIDYTVVFNVTLGAMPVDQPINLGTINIVANTTNDMVVKGINPVLKIREAIAAVDAEFAKLGATDLTAEFATRSTAEVAENDGVVVNGEEAEAGDKGYATFTLAAGVDEDEEDVLVDNSTITITEVADYANTIEVTETYTVCGVDYTVKATVVTGKPEFTFKPSTAFVTSDMKVNLPGNVSFKYADAKKLATAASVPFALEEIHLNDYVTVVIPEDYKSDYQVRYTLANNPLAKEVKEDGTIVWKENPETKKTFRTNDLPKIANKEVLESYYASVGDDVKLEWRSDLREMTYEIALVSATKVTNEDDETVDNVFASFEVTLVIEDLLTLTTNDVTVNCYKGNVEGKSANIVAGVNLVDAAGNTAYNPYALNVDQIWNGYEVKVDANGNLTSRTIKPDTFFNAYGQSFKFDENVKAFIGEEDVTASVHPAVSADGTVTLNPQSGAIQKAVTVKVPVKVTYTYDEYGVQAETATVNVVFNPTTTVEEDAPAVDATFETPEGKQWNLGNVIPQSVFGVDTDLIMDFGYTDHTKVIENYDINDVPQYGPAGKYIVMGLLWDAAYPGEGLKGYWPLYSQPGFGAMEYTVTAKDATSGTITFTPSMMGEVSVAYSNYDGSKCTFDFTNYGPAPVVINATLTDSVCEFTPPIQ